MNDDFLYINRPPVRNAFAQNLYQQLSRLDVDKPNQSRKIGHLKHTNASWSKWKFALPLLLITVTMAMIFIISEPVRARTLEWIRIVAGFAVEECNESPLAVVAQGQEYQPTTAVATDQTATVTPFPAFEPTIYAVPTLTLSDVLDNPPFQFGFPTWVPVGYTLDQTAGIATSNDWVLFVWNNPDFSEIEMLVEQEYTGYRSPAGENSSEEININGKPALLIRGFWNTQHQWESNRGISLDWEKDGHHYHLNYFEKDANHNEIKPIEGDMESIIQELVKMAESIPE